MMFEIVKKQGDREKQKKANMAIFIAMECVFSKDHIQKLHSNLDYQSLIPARDDPLALWKLIEKIYGCVNYNTSSHNQRELVKLQYNNLIQRNHQSLYEFKTLFKAILNQVQVTSSTNYNDVDVVTDFFNRNRNVSYKAVLH